MAREIKFRGKTSEGQIVYGDLVHLEIYHYPFGSGSHSKQSAFAINDEIVEEFGQLCSVDKNGHEVYEGDVLIDELENEHVAEIYDRPNFLASLVLKVYHGA